MRILFPLFVVLAGCANQSATVGYEGAIEKKFSDGCVAATVKFPPKVLSGDIVEIEIELENISHDFILPVRIEAAGRFARDMFYQQIGRLETVTPGELYYFDTLAAGYTGSVFNESLLYPTAKTTLPISVKLNNADLQISVTYSRMTKEIATKRLFTGAYSEVKIPYRKFNPDLFSKYLAGLHVMMPEPIVDMTLLYRLECFARVTVEQRSPSYDEVAAAAKSLSSEPPDAIDFCKRLNRWLVHYKILTAAHENGSLVRITNMTPQAALTMDLVKGKNVEIVFQDETQAMLDDVVKIEHAVGKNGDRIYFSHPTDDELPRLLKAAGKLGFALRHVFADRFAICKE